MRLRPATTGSRTPPPSRGQMGPFRSTLRWPRLSVASRITPVCPRAGPSGSAGSRPPTGRRPSGRPGARTRASPRTRTAARASPRSRRSLRTTTRSLTFETARSHSARSPATFAFASEPGARFECSLDGAAFTSCASPAAYSGLADGQHAFEVRARDTAGHVDPTPARRSWVVDTTAPDASIDAGPPSSTEATDATFRFSANEAGASFECSLDGSAFAACVSPIAYTGLDAREHRFRVRARDAVGNTDVSPATWTWTIETAPPPPPPPPPDSAPPATTIEDGPASRTRETTAEFRFAADEAGSTFQCSLDRAP